MKAEDVDKLRDQMTVDLMLATSSDTALQRYRAEVAIGYPAYDPDPRSNLRHLQPRDTIKRCPVCRVLFVEHRNGGLGKRFCSDRCCEVVGRARRSAEKEAV